MNHNNLYLIINDILYSEDPKEYDFKTDKISSMSFNKIFPI